MVLFEIAEQAGWKEGKDWEFVNTREYVEALLAGEVEAISWHPTTGAVATLVYKGTGREIAYPTDDSLYVNGGGATVYFTTREFADKYPNITKKFLQIHADTLDWMLANPEEAAAVNEKITRSPADVTVFGWSRSEGNWHDEKDLAKIIRETEAMQDWLIEHGDVKPEEKVEISKLFAPQYYN